MTVPRWLFIVAALLWLPAGVAATAPLRGFGFGADPAPWPMVVLMMASSLVVVAPAGLPLAIGCRRLWRLGRARAAWAAFAVLAPATVAASLLAGLLGPAGDRGSRRRPERPCLVCGRRAASPRIGGGVSLRCGRRW